VQIALDRGQRYVDDRGIEHDHQLRKAHDCERKPAAPIGGHMEVLSLGGAA
jgi:hypothetical protein